MCEWAFQHASRRPPCLEPPVPPRPQMRRSAGDARPGLLGEATLVTGLTRAEAASAKMAAELIAEEEEEKARREKKKVGLLPARAPAHFVVVGDWARLVAVLLWGCFGCAAGRLAVFLFVCALVRPHGQ